MQTLGALEQICRKRRYEHTGTEELSQLLVSRAGGLIRHRLETRLKTRLKLCEEWWMTLRADGQENSKRRRHNPQNSARQPTRRWDSRQKRARESPRRHSHNTETDERGGGQETRPQVALLEQESRKRAGSQKERNNAMRHGRASGHTEAPQPCPRWAS